MAEHKPDEYKKDTENIEKEEEVVADVVEEKTEEAVKEEDKDTQEEEKDESGAILEEIEPTVPMTEIQTNITEEEAEYLVKNGITEDYVRADEIEESHPEVAEVINDLGMEFVEQVEALKTFSQATQESTTLPTPWGDISTNSAIGGVVGIVLVIVLTATIIMARLLNSHREKMREANIKAHNSTRDDFLARLSDQQSAFLRTIDEANKSKDVVWREYVETLKNRL